METICFGRCRCVSACSTSTVFLNNDSSAVLFFRFVRVDDVISRTDLLKGGWDVKAVVSYLLFVTALIGSETGVALIHQIFVLAFDDFV